MLAFDRAAWLFKLALELGEVESSASLRVNLGDALANAGRGAEAAREYLAAAASDQSEKLDLERRAAEQFLRSGHIDEGLETIRLVLKSMNFKLAETPSKALLSVILQRLKLKLRGTKFIE